MTRHLVWLVLALSVLFNLGFAASYLNARSAAPDAAPSPEPATSPERPSAADEPRGPRGERGERGDRGEARLRSVARLLDLDEDQVAYFRGLHEGLAEDEAVFGTAIAALREALAEAYRAEVPEMDRLRSLHEREAELLRQRQLARSERFEAFMAALRPDQTERFRGVLQQQSRGEGRPEARERIAEFDADDDGLLDDAEIAEFRRRISERIRERTEMMLQRQREALGRFDADGDGRLDRSEREAAMQAEMIRRHDRDGDGRLDEAEQAAMQAEREAARQRWERMIGPRRGEGRGDGRGGPPEGRGGPDGSARRF